MIIESRIEEKAKEFIVGPDYLALLITAVTSAVAGGAWGANKILGRHHERIKVLQDDFRRHAMKTEQIEDQVNRLPLDYVLKVDFLREIQNMQDNFKQINSKLDKMMEKLLR